MSNWVECRESEYVNSNKPIISINHYPGIFLVLKDALDECVCVGKVTDEAKTCHKKLNDKFEWLATVSAAKYIKQNANICVN